MRVLDKIILIALLALIFSCKDVPDDLIIRCCSNFNGEQVVHFDLDVSDIRWVDTLNHILIVNESGRKKVGTTMGTIKEFLEVYVNGNQIGHINISCVFSSNRADYFYGSPYVVCDSKSKSILSNNMILRILSDERDEKLQADFLVSEIHKKWRSYRNNRKASNTFSYIR
jgi:hypothetical protein